MRKSILERRMAFNLELVAQPFNFANDGENNNNGGGNNNTNFVPPPNSNNNNNNNGGGNNNDYVNRSVLDAIISDRDKAKADLANAQKTIEDLNKIKSAFDELTGGNLDDFKKKFDELTNFKKTADEATKTEIEKAQAALKEAQDTAAKNTAKLEGEHKTTVEALNKTINDQKEQIAKLQNYKLTSSIYKAAVENNAANPEQIVLMLQNQFALDDKGEFSIKVKDEKSGQELPYGIAEYTKIFLAKEGNANLLAGDGKSGNGPRHTNINQKAPGAPDNSNKKDQKNDTTNNTGKTYLEQLGRPITESERSQYRIQGLSDEEIAMNIVLRQRAQEKVKKAREGKNDLFGESAY